MQDDLNPYLSLSAARDWLAERSRKLPDEAEALLVSLCRAGEVRVWCGPVGREALVPEAERADLMMDFRSGTAGPERTTQFYSLSPDLAIRAEKSCHVDWKPAVVSRRDVARCLGPVDGGLPQPRNKGGRPPRHDWVGAALRIGRYVHWNGAPDPRGLLVAHLRDWFASLGGDIPDDHQLRDFVTRGLVEILDD